MRRPDLDGVKLLKIPVRDLSASEKWWRDVYGAEVAFEFPLANGGFELKYLSVPGLESYVTLVPDPEHAAGIAGFNLVDFAVPTRQDLESWMIHLDRLGIQHTGLTLLSQGWAVRFSDCDGIVHQLYSREEHHIDLQGLPGRARPVR